MVESKKRCGLQFEHICNMVCSCGGIPRLSTHTITWLDKWDCRNLPNMWHLLLWSQEKEWGVDWEQKSLVWCKVPNKQNMLALVGTIQSVWLHWSWDQFITYFFKQLTVSLFRVQRQPTVIFDPETVAFQKQIVYLCVCLSFFFCFVWFLNWVILYCLIKQVFIQKVRKARQKSTKGLFT